MLIIKGHWKPCSRIKGSLVGCNNMRHKLFSGKAEAELFSIQERPHVLNIWHTRREHIFWKLNDLFVNLTTKTVGKTFPLYLGYIIRPDAQDQEAFHEFRYEYILFLKSCSQLSSTEIIMHRSHLLCRRDLCGNWVYFGQQSAIGVSILWKSLQIGKFLQQGAWVKWAVKSRLHYFINHWHRRQTIFCF